MLVFVAHNVVYYIASRTRSMLFCWSIGLALVVSFVSSDTLIQWQVGLHCTLQSLYDCKKAQQFNIFRMQFTIFYLIL
jgi:hypothetical protein